MLQHDNGVVPKFQMSHLACYLKLDLGMPAGLVIDLQNEIRKETPED